MSTTLSPLPLVFVIGGTGAQGLPTIRGLVHDSAYRVRFLTRDADSPRAKTLLAFPNVSACEGTFASETDLRAGFRGATYAFINIDGFNSGEKTEMFWAMRAYEVAIEEGVKFFVYGNLDFGFKKGGYDRKFRCGHYDGKGRIGEWILQQNRDPENRKRMGAALFTTGPYIDMAIGASTPMSPTVEDGIVTWRVPLGIGAVPHVDLNDCEYYVRWLFDHQDRANGMDLEVAIDLIPYHDLAKAFETVTGHPARFIDTDLDTYWSTSSLGFGTKHGTRICGYNSNPEDPAAMTYRQNFTGFWNLWKESGGNQGVVRRDFALLDEIFPGRCRSAEEWFRREEVMGRELGLGSLWERANELKPVLKIAEDGMKGRL